MSGALFLAPFIYGHGPNLSSPKQVSAPRHLQEQATPRPIKPKLPPFKFENYTDQHSLEDALKTYLYNEDPIEEIDRVLVKEGGAFRGDNLTWYKTNEGDYHAGTSSAENYVFYFKPSVLNGEHGWEKADDGWVLKVTHMGSGRGFLGGNLDMAPAGLLKVEVLSIPSNTDAKSVTIAKGFLQDKLDRTPINKFSEQNWDTLQSKFAESSCRSNPSFQCLVENSIASLELENNPLDVLYYPPIANLIISEGNTSLANTLLSTWPDQNKITKFEESLPRTKGYSAENIKSELNHFSDLKMQLLYVAGDYQQADEILAQSHTSRSKGEDFGAIAALVKKGDLDKALTIAKDTLTWPLEGKDGREGSSAIMHCNTYEEPTPRAKAMGSLGLEFIEKKEYDKAREVSELLKTYIENKAYGQKSFCHVGFASASYKRIMNALILNYAEQKDFETAKKLLIEQIDLLIAQNPTITNYNYGAYESMAKLSAAIGQKDQVLRLKDHMLSNLQIKYTDLGYKPHDPIVVTLALAKDYNSAFARMSDIDYKENAVPLDKLEQIINTQPIPNNEINMNSLMAAAESLKDVGDKEGTITLLDKAHSIMGHRTPKYDPAIENLTDYIARANTFYDLGLKDKSKEATDELLRLFDATSPQDYRGGQVTQRFYGEMAELIAKNNTVQTLQEWEKKLSHFYDGPSYASIGKLLIEEKRWAELDTYMPEMARVLSVDDGVPNNWARFTEALVNAKEFDRYSKFVSMVSKGSPEDKQHLGSNRQQIQPADYVEPKYTRNQQWLMTDLINAKMSGNEISTDMVAPIMSRYVEGCPRNYFILPKRGQDKANTADTMASCLLQLAMSYQYKKESLKRTKDFLDPLLK